MITTDRLLAVSGDSGEMVRQARILGRATAQLIQTIKVSRIRKYFIFMCNFAHSWYHPCKVTVFLKQCMILYTFLVVLQGEAEVQQDSELQRRLLSAAKTLADATARMVEAARLCASSPHDVLHQDALRHAAEDIRAAATSAGTTPAMRARTINRLEVRCSAP